MPFFIYSIKTTTKCTMDYSASGSWNDLNYYNGTNFDPHIASSFIKQPKPRDICDKTKKKRNCNNYPSCYILFPVIFFYSISTTSMTEERAFSIWNN